MQQRTICRDIKATGVSLHSGKKSTVAFYSAPENTGIVFIRNGIHIPAKANLVTQTTLATSLEYNGQKVQTIEHLLAAISSLLIDNLFIDVSSDEIPIMDGSAAPFVMLLKEAEICLQSSNKKFIKITRPVTILEKDKHVSLIPGNSIKYNVTIQFGHRIIDQHKTIVYDAHMDFMRDFSSARTFGFIKDIEHLRSKNLALGGGTHNAIVLDDYNILNDEPLRFDDEFVRHKLIDAVGDLRLLGHNFIGEFIGYKCGHDINNRLAREVLKQNAYEIITLDEKDSFINNSIQSQTLAEVL